MASVYVFKVSNKHQRTIWRKIQILETQTLGHLDLIIRESFYYDQHDHLSEFYRGKVWSSEGYGEIEPGGSGKGAAKKIKNLRIQVGDKLEYVYDFGDSFESKLELLNIIEAEEGLIYPRVSQKNRPKKIYCDECKENDKEELAIYRAYDYDEESVQYLCQSCADEVSEEIEISEID